MHHHTRPWKTILLCCQTHTLQTHTSGREVALFHSVIQIFTQPDPILSFDETSNRQDKLIAIGLLL